MHESAFESLDELAARLPFHLDDVDAVNAHYERWWESRKESDRHLIDLWTYCFIRRYFLVKFIQEATYGAADFDEVVDVTFQKVERAATQIKDPSRFASWVSVICKNTYLNYIRRRRQAVSLQSDSLARLVAEPAPQYHDVGMAHSAVRLAIERLPSYLQPCARMRFLDGLSYEEIGRRTGYPLPRIRTYINKAVSRFRDDDDLLDYLGLKA